LLLIATGLLSAATAKLLCRRLLTYLLVAGLSSTAMAHLFVFTELIEAVLENAPFMGAPVTGLNYILYALVDGLALLNGLVVALMVWWLAPFSPRVQKVFLPAGVAHLAVLIVLVLHNTGTISWPAAAYRSLSGFDAFIASYVEQANRPRQSGSAARVQAPPAAPESESSFEVLSEPLEPSPEPQQSQTAATSGDGTGIDSMPEVEVSSGEAERNTALRDAVERRDADLVRQLVAGGADVNLTGGDGQRPLHLLFIYRVSPDTSPILKQLLAAGADVNAADGDGMTPLCRALAFNDPEHASRAAEMLLRNGAELRPASGCAPAVQTQDLDLLQRMITAGAEVNAMVVFDGLTDNYGTYKASPLWRAAYSGNAERVALLLELGADVEQRDGRFGLTPLQALLEPSRDNRENSRRILEMLLDAGADPEAVAWDGRTTEEFDRQLLLYRMLASQ
jgi:hypothetical protein